MFGSKPLRGLAAILVAVFATVALAQDIGPDPTRPPEAVVRIQLEALQANDNPTPDAGIRQVWNLAHPDNQRATGPLARFALMIKGGFAPMIGHASHTIEALGTAPTGEATFKVTVIAADGAVLEYLWAVGQVADGPDKGAWLTTGVSPGRSGGRAI